jgi:hypothetical protein
MHDRARSKVLQHGGDDVAATGMHEHRTIAGVRPLLVESETGPHDFCLTRFLPAHRYPSSDQGRGQAPLEKALMKEASQ